MTNFAPQFVQAKTSSGLEELLRKYPVILQLLRFATIGALNTAVDFIILNFVSKTFGVQAGIVLGGINFIGVIAAITQSYFWNRYWTFGTQQQESPLKNLINLFLVGGLGLASFLAVLWGASIEAGPLYFMVILVVFLMGEVALWFGLGLHQQEATGQTHAQFLAFAVVSVIGVVINSGLLSVLSQYLIGAGTALNPDLIKNVAKFAATIASLAWNFVGYKLIVFKK